MIYPKTKTSNFNLIKARVKKKFKRHSQLILKINQCSDSSKVNNHQTTFHKNPFYAYALFDLQTNKKTFARRYNNKFKNRNKNKFKNKGKGKGKGKANAALKGVVNVKSTFNNTLITFTNLKGKVVGWSSAGTQGFKGARKSTAYAAKTTASDAAKKAIDKGVNRAKIAVKGGGPGRDNSLRGLAETGLELAVIRDVTGLPHNGCRPRKKRRV